MQRFLFVAAVCSLFITAHCDVLLVDSKGDNYLKQTAPVTLSGQSLSAVVSALTGLLPAELVSESTSQTVSRTLPGVIIKTRKTS